MSVDQDYHLYFVYNAQANVLEWVNSGLRQNRLLKPLNKSPYPWVSTPFYTFVDLIDMLLCWWVTVAIVSVSLFLRREIWLRHFYGF